MKKLLLIIKRFRRKKNILLILAILFVFKFYMTQNGPKRINDKRKFVVFYIKTGHGWGDRLEGLLNFIVRLMIYGRV